MGGRDRSENNTPSVRAGFEPLDARLKAGDGFLECVHAAVQFGVRDLINACVSPAVRSIVSSSVVRVRWISSFRCATDSAKSRTSCFVASAETSK
jgi:hypothetical protein